MLLQSASAQQQPISPERRCANSLSDRGIVAGTPALSSSAVRARACGCIAASLSTRASIQADKAPGNTATNRLDDVARSCVARAIAEEPIPHLPARTIASLSDAYEKPTEPPSFVPGKVALSSCARPEYPKSAAQRNATGTTRLSFQVDQSGKATDGAVVGSAGPNAAHKVLDMTALFSLMQCDFEPATLNGGAIESWVEVTYIWKLL